MLDGNYGQLTVNPDGAYSYTASNTAVINNAQTGAAPVDQFTLSVSDGYGATAAESFNIAVNRPPVLSGGGTVDYVSGNGPVGIEPYFLSLSDPDAAIITGATIAMAVSLAVVPTATLYSFRFTFKDGSFYNGTVASGGNYLYTAGQTIAGAGGFYKITSSAGATTDTPGTVRTGLYYDTATTQTYVPVLASSGSAAGSLGLGSETDSVLDPKGSTTFGLAGKSEALLSILTDYQFTFTYNDGSYYRGTVTDDGTKGYYVGDNIVTSAGKYTVYSSSLDPNGTAGAVSVSKYYDISDQQFYTPYVPAGGTIFGTQGLQSEFGQINTPAAQGFGWYVGDGHLISVEARAAANDAFQFAFTYNDGSYYTGEVIDNGQANNGDGYSVGEEFGNAYGYYTITKALGPTTDTSGNVYVDKYHNVSTNQDYTPEGHGKGPDGGAGLGSEFDSTDGPQGSQLFGQFGSAEARQSAHIMYDFTFQYTDGSHYTGQVVADSSFNYHAGTIIKTGYGFYTITGSEAGGTTDPINEVVPLSYYDVTKGESQQNVAYATHGYHGLGSEIGYFHNVEFGQGGALEAKLAEYAADNFTFYYYDGLSTSSDLTGNSFYIGTVTDGDNHQYYIGEQIETDYGIYVIDSAATANKGDNPGTGCVTGYHDQGYVPGLTVQPDNFEGADGTQGLGSELESVNGLFFGTGGQYEASGERTEFDFRFTYSDGAFYQGFVVGGPYYVGEKIPGAGGSYSIFGQDTTSKQAGLFSGIG